MADHLQTVTNLGKSSVGMYSSMVPFSPVFYNVIHKNYK